MNHELISIVLPTYKRPDRLRRSIESVLSQTYPHWELIVVDDNQPGSETRLATEEFMRQYVDDSRIVYVKNERNLGAALARNEGIKKAEGEYVAFLDDDDEFLPEKLEKQLQLYKSNDDFTKLGLVYCLSMKVDQDRRALSYNLVKVRGRPMKHHLKRNIAPCPSMMIKRKVLEEVGGFKDLICGQEWDLIRRILEEGYQVDCVDEILVVFHIHKDERISESEKMLEGLDHLFNEKERYFHLLSGKDIREIKHHHYLLKFQHYLDRGDMRSSLSEYLKMLKIRPLAARNAIEGLGFLFGYNGVLYIKRILHEFKRRLRLLSNRDVS